MSKVTKYGQMVKEILELGSKSAILADTKSKLFCKNYVADVASGDGPQFLRALSKEHGLKTDKLYSTVIKSCLLIMILELIS
jgi:hypothetical protein